VMGVLEETHTPGRYRLRSWQPLLRLNYTHLREIDIYFTDPVGTIIGAAVASDPTTASDITTHASIFMFLDFEDSTKITTVSPSGNLTEIISTNDANLEFQPSSGSGIEYGDWGETKAMDYAAVDTVQLRDDDGVAEPEQGFLCMIFQSQTDSSDYNIVDFYRWRILAVDVGDGDLTLNKHPASAAGDDSGIIVALDTPYLMTVKRVAGSGYGDTYNFEWRLEDLSSGGSTQTATTGSGDASSGTGLFSFGTSAYSNASLKIGSVIMMSSTAAADITLAQDFLRDRYKGTSTSSSTSVDLDATFFSEIDIDTK